MRMFVLLALFTSIFCYPYSFVAEINRSVFYPRLRTPYVFFLCLLFPAFIAVLVQWLTVASKFVRCSVILEERIIPAPANRRNRGLQDRKHGAGKSAGI